MLIKFVRYQQLETRKESFDMSSFNPVPIKLIGYCETCGFPIYAPDFVRIDHVTINHLKEQINIYKCIHCKKEVKEEDLIPF